MKEGISLTTARLVGYSNIRSSLHNEEFGDFRLLHFHTIRDGGVNVAIRKVSFKVDSDVKSSFAELEIPVLNGEFEHL